MVQIADIDPVAQQAVDDHARGSREGLLALLMVPLIIALGAFLNRIGQYALVGRHPFQFFADSATYQDIYLGVRTSPDALIDLSYNYLGPMLILTVAGGNIYLVMLLNVAIFYASMIFICRALSLDPIKASTVMLLCPMTLSSLASVNKEIIAFPLLALLLQSYGRRSLLLFAGAIVVSVLARWQLTLFCVALGGLFFVRNGNRYVLLALLLLTISTAYFLSQDLLEPVLRNADFATSTFVEGSGLFERLNELQNDGLYFAVAPIKAAHLMFSLGLNISAMLNPIIVYNDQVVAAYCLYNIVLFGVLLATRSLKVGNDLIFMSLVYRIVFALSPIYAPRYLFLVTVLWALVAVGARGVGTPATAEHLPDPSWPDPASR